MNTHDPFPRCFVIPTFRPQLPFLFSTIRAAIDRRFDRVAPRTVQPAANPMALYPHFTRARKITTDQSSLD